MENDTIFKDLIQTVALPITSFTVSGDIKKNEEKSSENMKNKKIKLGHFRSFFIYFFRPPTLNLNFFPVNQLIKKIWP